MSAGARKTAVRAAASRLAASHGSLPQLWGRRGFWQIRLRWAVAPVMVAAVLLGRALGFDFPLVPILIIAAASPLYNLLFALIYSHYPDRLKEDPRVDRVFITFQIIIDYVAMFLLIHFTGGVSSPLVIFLLFHVIIAAIQFSATTAVVLAALAAGGLWIMLAGHVTGLFPGAPIVFRGEPVHALDRPVYIALVLLFFSAALLITATMVSAIMQRFRSRVGDLAEVTTELGKANDQLNSFYAMVCAIAAERRTDAVLSTVVSELARVMGVRAVAVKLLDEPGKTLRYVAAHGLPDELVSGAVIELDKSPLNRRVIAGETIANSRVSRDGSLQLQDELIALGIRGAVLTPLRIEDRVIGTLGLYSGVPDRFNEGEAEFLELAARLIAIAIEDARANDAIERLIEERTQFMLEVAHNLRAPLSAGLGLLDLVRSGGMGPIADSQAEALQRVDARLRALHQTIGELLTIARARDWSREIPDVVVDIEALAQRTRQTFEQEAERKGVRLAVVVKDGVPSVDSGANLLEQVMENLVSNAIKYTPAGGDVRVEFSRIAENQIRIMVQDSGIGIPAAEQNKLFREFFRASNAKKVTSAGTGLGLTLVKQTVERHSGRIMLTSDEGQGTTVVIDLPIRQAKRAQSSQE